MINRFNFIVFMRFNNVPSDDFTLDGIGGDAIAYYTRDMKVFNRRALFECFRLVSVGPVQCLCVWLMDEIFFDPRM